MVAKGQFLERSTLIPVEDFVLEGLSHRGNGPYSFLILPPLPEEGGGMENTLVAELAWAAATSGFASLRFNFRGVGASQGSYSRREDLEADTRSALSQLKQNATSAVPILVAFGQATSLACTIAAQDHLKVCLISPSAECFDGLGEIESECLVVWAEFDKTNDLMASKGRFRLEVIPGADRQFVKSLPQMAKAVMRWVSMLG